MSPTDSFEPPDCIDHAVRHSTVVRLGCGAKGMRGIVVRVGVEAVLGDGMAAAELERRLLEIGFVEGAQVEIIHEGPIRRDPIAVRLDDMRVALRRREADAILVRLAAELVPRVERGR